MLKPPPSNAHAFKAAWWCRSPHAQTLLPYLFRFYPKPAYRRERLTLQDSDFLDLDFLDAKVPQSSLVILLHGLEGSSASHYARGISHALHKAGFGVVVMHFRGCSGEANRLDRTYHSGETGDIAELVSVLQQRFPSKKLYAIGISLGGNVLLKWLGELGKASPLDAAVAVSVPFELSKAAQRLEQGFSRFYQWHLVTKLKQSLGRKYPRDTMPVSIHEAEACRSFRQFDDCVTAPLHGFDGVDDYYTQSSSRQYLHAIRVPTLILQAMDDPFLPLEAIPNGQELSDTTILELCEQGGHVGFVSGSLPLWPQYWLDQRITHFLHAQQKG